MLVLETLAGAPILSADVLAYWAVAIYVVLAVGIGALLARKYHLRPFQYGLLAIALLGVVYHFIFHGASICPHYGEFGFIILVSVCCFLCALIFASKKHWPILVGFIVVGFLSIHVAEEGTFSKSYEVIFEDKKVFWSP